ncbi:MAG: IS1634 family transposase [Elusimicrobiota bacterium]|jgi:transposase|nr:IS1634 family transposase [Elusimicrobiota bacterium]
MTYVTKRFYKKKGENVKITYYYLARSERINGVSRPKILRSLGTIEDIEKIYSSYSIDNFPDPTTCTILEFGSIAALYDIAQRLNIEGIIDKYAIKRDQGPTIGNYILLAAINRAVAPVSKKSFYGWFKDTILISLYNKCNEKNLSSSNFWHQMVALSPEIIEKIEDEITETVINTYNIPTNSLSFDNTNFITYISTANNALIPQRGHSKEKRTDLKIVGLSLMVSTEHNIPLFHQIYPGNKNDATQFSDLIDKIKLRYHKLNPNDDNITLVFDKGNNSAKNIQHLESTNILNMHFIGGLKFAQCKELLNIDSNQFLPLKGDEFKETTVFRTTKELYGNNYTVLVTYNPALKDAQLAGIKSNIYKCINKFEVLKLKLQNRTDGIIKKGVKPTGESVLKNIKSILTQEHMSTIFDYDISSIGDDKITISYSLNNDKFEILKNQKLGKTILFTNRHEWDNEQIVSAYRSQFHVEEAFKQLKNTKYLSFRPIRHFTDKTIIVHGFYCVLSYLLVSLLKLELHNLGMNLSINNILDMLSKAKQVINIFENETDSSVKVKPVFSKQHKFAKIYIEKYELKKYGLQGDKIFQNFDFLE